MIFRVDTGIFFEFSCVLWFSLVRRYPTSCLAGRTFGCPTSKHISKHWYTQYTRTSNFPCAKRSQFWTPLDNNHDSFAQEQTDFRWYLCYAIHVCCFWVYQYILIYVWLPDVQKGINTLIHQTNQWYRIATRKYTRESIFPSAHLSPCRRQSYKNMIV